MNSSFTVDLSNLKKIFARFQGEAARKLAQEVVSGKQVAALLSQAIAQNFREEGPGWTPLKIATIRASVSKAVRKRLITRGGQLFDGKTGERPRQILYRTGMLYKSVTTPGANGNVYRVRGTTIEWGTNLHYAGIHNRGGIIKHPGSKNAFGIRGFNTRPHKIAIPARPYLKLSEYWRMEIETKVVNDFAKGLVRIWRGNK